MFKKSDIKFLFANIILATTIVIGGTITPTLASTNIVSNGVTYTTVGEGSTLSPYYYNKYGNAPAQGTIVAQYDNTQVFKNGNVFEVWVVSDAIQGWTLCDKFSW